MQAGVAIIHQGVLWDAQNRNYGATDFLVRSDVLREMFPGDLTESEASLSAPDLGNQGWHYLVVDTKFTTLHLNASGDIGNNGSAPAYKAQLYVYNQMLGRLQGFEPPASFLTWKRVATKERSRRQRIRAVGAGASIWDRGQRHPDSRRGGAGFAVDKARSRGGRRLATFTGTVGTRTVSKHEQLR